MPQVLFLCSGNYYRSRFAEVLFNHLALQSSLNWHATSRGLRVRPESGNVGPISMFALTGLADRGIPLPPKRFPQQVIAEDFPAADVVIAVKEAEHRIMMQTNFPQFAQQVRYWHVHDLDCALPHVALAELHTLVQQLIEELSTAKGSTP